MNNECQEHNEESMWDQAIREAEAKIKNLRAAIGSFKAHRDAGLPWPKDEKNGNRPEVRSRLVAGTLPNPAERG